MSRYERISILPLCPAVPLAAKPPIPPSVKHLLLVNLEWEDKGENLEKREDQSEEVICSKRHHRLAWVAEVSF